MKTSITNLLCLVFAAATGVLAAYLYPSLPEQIPTHWNLRGEVDDYTSKPWGVIMMAIAPMFTFGLMKVIPVISPRGFRTDQFTGVFNIITVALVGFMSMVAVLVLLTAKGVDVRLNEMIYAGVGLLFIIIGNYLGKVRKNFFLGIRTPWTLASNEVWSRTHRLGGRMFIAAGVILFVNAFLGVQSGWLIVAILALALYPVVHSYLLYRRIEGFGPEEEESVD